MPHHRSVLIGLTVIALSVASLAAVCGNPDAADTLKADKSATAAASDAATAIPETPRASITTERSATATPVPAATGTPSTSVFGYPETSNLPTASSDAEAMLLGGGIWVDAEPVNGEVVAYIGDVECGKGKTILLPDGFLPIFYIEIKSAQEQPGCGTPGAQIKITLNGRAMNETISWQPGMQPPLNLVAGPAFAQFRGTIRYDAASFTPIRVIPYIDGVACGSGQTGFQGNGEVPYEVIVRPDELNPGCGRDGAIVELRLEGTANGTAVVMTIDTIAWRVGPATVRPAVDVSADSLPTPVGTAAP